MTDPVFISEEAILELHLELLEAFGGPPGLNQRLVESVAAYPLQKLAYQDPPPTIQELGAYYAYAAATTHAFTDGNKRVALALLDVFLIQNDYELTSSDEENIEVIRSLADGSISEEDIVHWVIENSSAI